MNPDQEQNLLHTVTTIAEHLAFTSNYVATLRGLQEYASEDPTALDRIGPLTSTIHSAMWNSLVLKLSHCSDTQKNATGFPKLFKQLRGFLTAACRPPALRCSWAWPCRSPPSPCWRILTDHGLTRTELGVVALGCAAIDDVTAWCLLAFVVGIARAQIGQGLLVTAGALGYIAGMLLIARPLLRRVAARWTTEPLPRGPVAEVFVTLLLSALTAEVVGIHAIFGAFFLGAVIPHESVVARTLTRQLEHLVTVLLLPAFLAFLEKRRNFGRQGNYLLSYKHLWALSENEHLVRI
jgi:Sodium/hydrogen exchanger family